MLWWGRLLGAEALEPRCARCLPACRTCHCDATVFFGAYKEPNCAALLCRSELSCAVLVCRAVCRLGQGGNGGGGHYHGFLCQSLDEMTTRRHTGSRGMFG